MSLTDAAVQRAVERGLRADDFHKGAQTNANSAWLFGLGGLGIGFFFSWKLAVVFGLIVVWSIFQSMQATSVALRLGKLES